MFFLNDRHLESRSCYLEIDIVLPFLKLSTMMSDTNLSNDRMALSTVSKDTSSDPPEHDITLSHRSQDHEDSSPTFNPDTWFTLAAEIKDSILEYVFLDQVVVKRRDVWTSRGIHQAVQSILSVSKHFVDKRQVINAMLRSATLAFEQCRDLSRVGEDIIESQRQLVQKLHCTLSDPHFFSIITPNILVFGELGMRFPRLSSISLDFYYASDDLEIDTEPDSLLWTWSFQNPDAKDMTLLRRDWDCDERLTSASAQHDGRLAGRCSITDAFNDLDARQRSDLVLLKFGCSVVSKPDRMVRSDLGDFVASSVAAGIEVICSWSLRVWSFGCPCAIRFDVSLHTTTRATPSFQLTSSHRTPHSTRRTTAFDYKWVNMRSSFPRTYQRASSMVRGRSTMVVGGTDQAKTDTIAVGL